MVVSRAEAKGQVRVIVDAASGGILSSVHQDFGSTPPDWWLHGLNSPPAGKQ